MDSFSSDVRQSPKTHMLVMILIFLMLFWFKTFAHKNCDQPNTYVLKLAKTRKSGNQAAVAFLFLFFLGGDTNWKINCKRTQNTTIFPPMLNSSCGYFHGYELGETRVAWAITLKLSIQSFKEGQNHELILLWENFPIKSLLGHYVLKPV